MIATISPRSSNARTNLVLCTETTTTYYYTICIEIKGGKHCETRRSFAEISYKCITVGGGGSGGGVSASPFGPGVIGGGGAPVPSRANNIPGQEKPGIDVNAYTDCFGLGNPAASYQLTLYVAEPNAGTGATKFGSDVGHAFIGFKATTNGSTVEQIMGYYPTESAFGWVGSKMADNGGSPYTVSVAFSVSSGKFVDAINAARYLQGTLYNISQNNCTDAAFYIFDAVGIPLPKTISTFPYGADRGHSPGQLGLDLRKAGSPNTKPGKAPLSKGPC